MPWDMLLALQLWSLKPTLVAFNKKLGCLNNVTRGIPCSNLVDKSSSN